MNDPTHGHEQKLKVYFAHGLSFLTTKFSLNPYVVLYVQSVGFVRISLDRGRISVLRFKAKISAKGSIPVAQQHVFSGRREYSNADAIDPGFVAGGVHLVVFGGGSAEAIRCLGKLPLDPTLDLDLENQEWDGQRHRTGRLYWRPPFGWTGFGITWPSELKLECLDMADWIVTYSAVHPSLIAKVTTVGYTEDVIRILRSMDGNVSGVRSTPDPKLAAKWARATSVGNRRYIYLIENRVRQGTVGPDIRRSDERILVNAKDIVPCRIWVKRQE